MVSLVNMFEEDQLLKKRKYSHYPAFSIPKNISINFAKKIIQHLNSNNIKSKIAAKIPKTFDLILDKDKNIVKS